MQITVIHKIFYNNFSLNLNLNVRTTGMWCYTFVWFFFIWSVPSTINRWSQQDYLSREIWANWLNLILTFSSWPIFIPALTLIFLRNMHKVCSQFISIDKVRQNRFPLFLTQALILISEKLTDRRLTVTSAYPSVLIASSIEASVWSIRPLPTHTRFR